MNFRKLFDFLRLLNTEGNNNKVWIDKNRAYYEEVRDEYIAFLNALNQELQAVHEDYHPTTGKKAINRINNNKLYQPNKPTYKDHFGAALDQAKEQADFYIHLGINGSFLAGGFYHANNEQLKKIRSAIDYDGEKLIEIINAPEFKKYFGDLMRDDSLVNAPKGYSTEHPHIDLLKLKSFVVIHDLTQKEIIASGFKEELIKAYKLMLPFRQYLNKAVSFEED